MSGVDLSKNSGISVGWPDLWREGYLTTALIASFGIWLHAADELLVATVMPHAIGDIGGAEFIAWTFALYEIGSIIASASAAYLAIRFGLRKTMSWAALLYSAGCAASAAAPVMEIMLAGRLAQGLGGGALVALSFLVIATLIPARLMARAMGLLSLVWGLSAFMGPLIGGLFAEAGYWRGSFWLFAIQAIVLIALIRGMLPRANLDRNDQTPSPVPFLRLACLSGGVVSIAAAGIDVAPLRSGALVAAGIVLIWAFLALDRRSAARRLLPHRAFDFRLPAGAGLVMILAFSFATIPISVYGPALMQTLHGASAIAAGYVLAAASIAWSVVAILTSGAPESADTRLIRIGMSLAFLSILGLVYSIPGGPIALIGVCAALLGGGFGMAWTFILRRMVSLAPEDERERLSTAIPTTQRFGYAAGAAFAGIVANVTGFSAMMDASQATIVGLAVFAVMVPVGMIGLLAARNFTRGQHRSRGNATEIT